MAHRFTVTLLITSILPMNSSCVIGSSPYSGNDAPIFVYFKFILSKRNFMPKKKKKSSSKGHVPLPILEKRLKKLERIVKTRRGK